MKKYTAKTVDDCLKLASLELELAVEDLLYEVNEEKKGLFTKRATISVFEVSDIIEYAETYITDVCHELGIEVSLKTFANDGLIKILVETNHNPIIIGKNGETLQAFNELVKLAVSSKFHKKFRILIDISQYKEKKYGKVISIAKRVAKTVQRTHVDAKLDPMTPDERKKVHNALANWNDIKTESIGDGKDRSIVIKYVGNGKPIKPRRTRNRKNFDRAPKENVEVKEEVANTEVAVESSEE